MQQAQQASVQRTIEVQRLEADYKQRLQVLEDKLAAAQHSTAQRGAQTVR